VESVVLDAWALVSMFTAVTETPAMTAPVLSVTTPVIDPVISCASAAPPNTMSAAT